MQWTGGWLTTILVRGDIIGSMNCDQYDELTSCVYLDCVRGPIGKEAAVSYFTVFIYGQLLNTRKYNAQLQ